MKLWTIVLVYSIFGAPEAEVKEYISFTNKTTCEVVRLYLIERIQTAYKDLPPLKKNGEFHISHECQEI